MEPENLLTYGLPFPGSKVFEGLYIDDHIVLAIIPDNGDRPGLDLDIIESSHRAYAHYHLPLSSEKAFGLSRPGTVSGDINFVAWGTEVLGRLGVVSAPTSKLAHLFLLVGKWATFKYTNKEIMQRMVALFIHPFMHLVMI